MRPFGTSQQLAKRRQQALRLLHRGQTPQQVARKMGTNERSVRRWQQELHCTARHEAARALGRPARLTPTQLDQLKQTLHQGARAHGYTADYWTLARITQLIWDLFAVRYDVSSVWHLLRRLGWSCQQPQRRAFGNDPVAVQRWRRVTWYRIKKVA